MAASATLSIHDNPSVATPAYSDGNVSPSTLTALQVIRRNGAFSPFDATKISVAITKAFIAVEGAGAASSHRTREAVEALTRQIVGALNRRGNPLRAIPIEDIQDQVELALMRSGEHKVARAYVLYREERAQQRRKREQESAPAVSPKIRIRHKDGRLEAIDEQRLHLLIAAACEGLEDVSPEAILAEVRKNLYDGMLLA